MAPKAEAAALRDAWVMAGMATAAASAAMAGFTGMRGLALDTGWPSRLTWLLPVTLDAYTLRASLARRHDPRRDDTGASASTVRSPAPERAGPQNETEDGTRTRRVPSRLDTQQRTDVEL